MGKARLAPKRWPWQCTSAATAICQFRKQTECRRANGKVLEKKKKSTQTTQQSIQHKQTKLPFEMPPPPPTSPLEKRLEGAERPQSECPVGVTFTLPGVCTHGTAIAVSPGQSGLHRGRAVPITMPSPCSPSWGRCARSRPQAPRHQTGLKTKNETEKLQRGCSAHITPFC